MKTVPKACGALIKHSHLLIKQFLQLDKHQNHLAENIFQNKNRKQKFSKNLKIFEHFEITEIPHFCDFFEKYMIFFETRMLRENIFDEY